MCVAEVRTGVFNVFTSSTKLFVCSRMNTFVFYLEVGLEPPKKNRSKGRKASANFNSSRDGPGKVQKQGRQK